MNVYTKNLLSLIHRKQKGVALILFGFMMGLQVYAYGAVKGEGAIAVENVKAQTTSLISNISASSGKSYTQTELAVGVKTYTDRTYQVTSVPSSLAGASLIQTANDDKKYTGSTQVSFSLSSSATIYIAYDPRGTTLPSWLSGWQKLTDRIGVNDSKISYMDVYSKTFAAGTVSLGGNLQSPAAGAENNYFVVGKQTTASATGLISNITTTTGRSYTQTELAVGVKAYTDRTYQVTSVPSSLAGASLIQTANDDKKYTGSTQVSFSLSSSATIYIAYDPRGTTLPSWLSGWQKLTDRVGVNDPAISYMSLYSKTFAAGTVSLGGNLQSPAAGAQNNYFVIAKPATTSSGLISNITTTTGKSYTLASLAVGVKAYTDRTYQVTSVPSSLAGASLIQTANDDKKYTGSTQVSFSLSSSATIYIAYDPRGTTLPSWLSGWQKLTDRVGVNDPAISYMSLYSKTFAAGTVSLGGNLQSPAAGAQNNYFVIAKQTTSTGEDNIAPTVAVQLDGVLKSAGTYSNEVTVSVQASDEGGSGLASVQYSLNNGSYTTYNAPFKITTEGSYTIRGRATDGSGNQTTTDAKSFSIVKSSQSNAYMVLENADKFPANDQLTFSLIQNPWRRQNADGSYTPYNANHDKVRLRIHNKGTGTLNISNLNLSNTSIWRLAEAPTLPISISSKGYVDVIIEFIAKDQATRVKVIEGTLTISSNDDLAPNKEVKLRGLWQRYGEGNSEPYAVEILSAFGFKSRPGFTANDGASDGTYVMPNSDEIYSPFFLRADPSKPVQVVQMAAYHGCCSDTETIQWYDKGSTTNRTIFTHNSLDGQSLLPRKSGSTTILAQGTFNPTTAFGIKVQRSYSDRTKNFEQGLGLRIWKAVDINGNIIPNAYIIGMDYLTSQFVNYDYQDNIYYVSNIKPETGPAYTSELAATPSAVNFGAVLTGGSKSLTVNLKNLGKSYDSGSDPAIQISKVEVVGPNSSEFTGPTLSTTLATQATTNITVGFRPSSLGIKNAALLVHYNSAASPLRIPLYGIANTSSSTISAVKRIKGASDGSKTIAGNVWEADINYRKGSIKLDQQVVAGPIASTDDDVLYQTYLSASTDLAETRYEIPISNGSYMVRMHFVENYFSVEGARIFNITIENALRLNGFEIFREVGYRAALVKDFNVNVADGVMNIKFNPTANRVAIAGVEIFKATSSAASASVSSSLLAVPGEETGVQLSVYPNPSSGGNVQVEGKSFGERETVSLSIYDALGRVIKSQDVVTDQEGSFSEELTLDGHTQRGLYLLQAKGLTGRRQVRLVIE